MATAIPELIQLPEFPSRAQSQQQFDSAIQAALTAYSTFTSQMIHDVLPWMQAQITSAANVNTDISEDVLAQVSLASGYAQQAGRQADFAVTQANIASGYQQSAVTAASAAATDAVQMGLTSAVTSGGVVYTQVSSYVANSLQAAVHSGGVVHNYVSGYTASALAAVDSALRTISSGGIATSLPDASAFEAFFASQGSASAVADTSAVQAAVASVDDRLTQHEISDAQQTVHLTRASQEQGRRLDTLNALVHENQYTTTRQATAFARASLAQSVRIQVQVEKHQREHISLACQNAHLALASQRQGRRLDACAAALDEKITNNQLAAALHTASLALATQQQNASILKEHAGLRDAQNQIADATTTAARVEAAATENQLSAALQTTHVLRALRAQGQRMQRLDTALLDNQLSAARQHLHILRIERAQDKRMDALAANQEAHCVSATQQAAAFALASLLQSQRLETVSQTVEQLVSWLHVQLARLSLASVLQSKRIGVHFPPAEYQWHSTETGAVINFPRLFFSPDDDGEVLSCEGLTFNPV